MYKTDIASEIESFILNQLEQKFKKSIIQKIFFEIGNYENEYEEPCADFHAVIASKDECDRVIERYINEYKYSNKEATEISNYSGEYITEDDRNCIRFNFDPLKKYKINFMEAFEIAKIVVSRIQKYDFSNYKTTDNFVIHDLTQYS